MECHLSGGEGGDSLILLGDFSVASCRICSSMCWWRRGDHHSVETMDGIEHWTGRWRSLYFHIILPINVKYNIGTLEIKLAYKPVWFIISFKSSKIESEHCDKVEEKSSVCVFLSVKDGNVTSDFMFSQLFNITGKEVWLHDQLCFRMKNAASVWNGQPRVQNGNVWLNMEAIRVVVYTKVRIQVTPGLDGKGQKTTTAFRHQRLHWSNILLINDLSILSARSADGKISILKRNMNQPSDISAAPSVNTQQTALRKISGTANLLFQ